MFKDAVCCWSSYVVELSHINIDWFFFFFLIKHIKKNKVKALLESDLKFGSNDFWDFLNLPLNSRSIHSDSKCCTWGQWNSFSSMRTSFTHKQTHLNSLGVKKKCTSTSTSNFPETHQFKSEWPTQEHTLLHEHNSPTAVPKGGRV